MPDKESTLIIGGAGFLGNDLTKVLVGRNKNVIVADSKRRFDRYLTPQTGVDYVSCDWPDTSNFSKLGAVCNVVHLAWSSNPSSSMANITGDVSTNLMGTLHLLDTLSANSVKRFLFMSSGGTVYGDNATSVQLLNECDPTSPISSYGITKLACEKYVNLYAARFGFTPLNIRLGNPYGPYQLRGTPVGVIANFIRKIFSEQAIDLYGDGLAVRDYIHIDDVSQSIAKILESSSASGTYNLGSGQGTTVVDILNAIEAVTSHTVSVNYHDERRADVRSVVLDTEKLDLEIGACRIRTLSAGIENMILSMKENIAVDARLVA